MVSGFDVSTHEIPAPLTLGKGKRHKKKHDDDSNQSNLSFKYI